MDIDLASLMVPVVRRFHGNPNEDLSTREELRWGNKGSLAVKVKEGVWYDHETKEGGGCLDFIRRHNSGDPFDWLCKERLIEDDALIATFDYRDEQNKLLYQVCRTASKKFWQRQPNGSGRWVNNIKGIRRVLYRLPELLASSDPVFIPEGEKHVDALIKLGLCATCNVMGAGKWRKEYGEFLRGRDVVLLSDNDKAGQDHTDDIARNLSGVARRVRVLTLPNLKPKGDVLNWLEAGGTRAELLRLADVTAIWEETRSGNAEDGGHYETRDRHSPQAAALVRLAQAAEPFHTPQSKTYADIHIDGHRETWSVRSRNFKLWLAGAFFKKTGKTPRREAMSAALDQVVSAHSAKAPSGKSIFASVGSTARSILISATQRGAQSRLMPAAGASLTVHRYAFGVRPACCRWPCPWLAGRSMVCAPSSISKMTMTSCWLWPGRWRC